MLFEYPSDWLPVPLVFSITNSIQWQYFSFFLFLSTLNLNTCLNHHFCYDAKQLVKLMYSILIDSSNLKPERHICSDMVYLLGKGLSEFGW